MRSVVALALDGLVTFDLGVAVQAFARGPNRDGEPAGFTLRTAGEQPRVATVDGVTLEVQHGLDALPGADIVVVPGRHPHDAPLSRPAADALRAAHAGGATVLSICIGAWVLAAAGLLDGRPAITHWAYLDDFATAYPRVDVQRDRLYVDDGDILTSAGLAAGLDLCLHLVRRERGTAAAAALARWNVVAPHREGGQAEYAPPPTQPLRLEGLGPTLAWALEHLGEDLPLTRLAAHAHVSTRTFHRRFQAELGTSPKRWLLDQRLARARELLETTPLPIETVARRAGLPGAAALREHMQSRLQTTPSRYRQTFGKSQPPGPGPDRSQGPPVRSSH